MGVHVPSHLQGRQKSVCGEGLSPKLWEVSVKQKNLGGSGGRGKGRSSLARHNCRQGRLVG